MSVTLGVDRLWGSCSYFNPFESQTSASLLVMSRDFYSIDLEQHSFCTYTFHRDRMEKKVFTDYVLRFHPIIMNLSTCSPLIRLDLVKALMPPKDFTKLGMFSMQFTIVLWGIFTVVTRIMSNITDDKRKSRIVI